MSFCESEKATGTQKQTIIRAPQFVQAPLAALMPRQTSELPGLVIRIGELMLEVYNHADSALLQEVLGMVKINA